MISIEEIKEKQEELNKMIEEYESQKEDFKEDLLSTWDKNWNPKEDEEYYFINVTNIINIAINNNINSNFHEEIIKHNRIFQTEELAEKWLEIDTYLREKSFEPDWNDKLELKSYIAYDYKSKKFLFNYDYNQSYFVKFYFESEEIIEEIFEKYTTEELKFYFNIGE